MEKLIPVERTYRGIKVDVKLGLYKKNGQYNNLVKKSLDILVDLLEENGHKLLSEYSRNSKKVLIDFKCGHEPHLIKPNNYKSGQGCPKCGDKSSSKKQSKKAREEFPLLVASNGHKLLTPYGENCEEKVLIDFNCSHEPHLIRPNDYKRGDRCPKCGDIEMAKKLSKKARESFKSFVESKEHILLTSYGKNRHQKVLIDFRCGHNPHWISPANYKGAKGCPECGIVTVAEKKKCQSKEYLLSVISSNKHELLSEYVGNNVKVLIDFKCGHEPHWVTASNYKKGYGCPKCSNNDVEKAKDKLISLISVNDHLLLSEYKDAKSKVLVDFKCGHIPHWISPDNYKRGKRCPHCSESKGEKIIREWLESKNIAHTCQFSFSKSRKRYDLMLETECAIVEVHGLQHYEEVQFYKKSTLKERQLNDKKKRQYAEAKGFKYIVVDYREHDSKLALRRFIEAYNKLP